MWQTFGFEKIKNYFDKLIEAGNLNHAYLFSGEEMIGKRTFALEISSKLTGERNVNRFIIDASDSASGLTISIDNIRALKNFMALSPYGGGSKTAIINDAHLMTVEAQNALLKILEEPTGRSVFFLITSSPTLLLPTVTSRCQEMRFPTPGGEIADRFVSAAKINREKAKFAICLAGGRLGLIKRAVENGVQARQAIDEFERLLNLDLNGRFAAAQKLTDDKNKADLQKKILYWILHVRANQTLAESDAILRGLLTAHEKAGQPQLNQRLALESFLVNI